MKIKDLEAIHERLKRWTILAQKLYLINPGDEEGKELDEAQGKLDRFEAIEWRKEDSV